MQHPFVWAACVRYLCCEAVRQRVFVDADTFLLVRSAHRIPYHTIPYIYVYLVTCNPSHALPLLQVLVAGLHVQYFEVYIQPGGAHAGGAAGCPMNSEDDFVSSDFTVDLSIDPSAAGKLPFLLA